MSYSQLASELTQKDITLHVLRETAITLTDMKSSKAKIFGNGFLKGSVNFLINIFSLMPKSLYVMTNSSTF